MVPGMGEFFEPPPSEPHVPEPRYRMPAWMGPPKGTLPAVVPFERVLARTETVAVCLARLAVYPTGFEFRVLTMSDDAERALDPFFLEGRYRQQHPDDTEGIPAEMLRFGLQFADGSKVTNVTPHWPHPNTKPSTPILTEMGGGGDWDQTFWIWPLPPPGPFTFVCEWPAVGIALTRHEIDAALILDAVPHAQVVFSDEHLPEWPSDEDGPQVIVIH